jgi:hypothetical protein
MYFSQVRCYQFLGHVNDMVLWRNKIYILFCDSDLNRNNIISGIEIKDKFKKSILKFCEKTQITRFSGENHRPCSSNNSVRYESIGEPSSDVTRVSIWL